MALYQTLAFSRSGEALTLKCIIDPAISPGCDDAMAVSSQDVSIAMVIGPREIDSVQLGFTYLQCHELVYGTQITSYNCLWYANHELVTLELCEPQLNAIDFTGGL